jgi:hypothetical protein
MVHVLMVRVSRFLGGRRTTLQGIEAARGGKQLPKGVEQGIMASGLLLLMGTGIVLVLKDTLNLLGV